jgi:hypothetical protein
MRPVLTKVQFLLKSVHGRSVTFCSLNLKNFIFLRSGPFYESAKDGFRQKRCQKVFTRERFLNGL